MVLDHTNEYIKLRGISVKFAWFQHPPPPPHREVHPKAIEYSDFMGAGAGASIFFCIYLIIACNIDFFIYAGLGYPLNILKKYGKYGIFLGEIWDKYGIFGVIFKKYMGLYYGIFKIFSI